MGTDDGVIGGMILENMSGIWGRHFGMHFRYWDIWETIVTSQRQSKDRWQRVVLRDIEATFLGVPMGRFRRVVQKGIW